MVPLVGSSGWKGARGGPGIAGNILFLDPGAVYKGALYL